MDNSEERTVIIVFSKNWLAFKLINLKFGNWNICFLIFYLVDDFDVVELKF